MADRRMARDVRPLTERVRPTTLDELVGNAPAISKLRKWAADWTESTAPPRVRAALLQGPAGVGKTSAALALAAEVGWTVVEMNASDARNQSSIEQVAGRASLSHTLGSSGVYRDSAAGGRTLILLDEADCLTGRATEESKPRASTVSLREFLKGRYQTVEALAAGWGLGGPGAPPAFQKWEQVPTTGGRGAWTRLPPAQRDLADWKGAAKPKDSTDRGGLGAIARLVRDTRQPLLMTVNDDRPLTRYSPVFRSGVEHIRFYPVREAELKALLRRVAIREGYEISPAAVDAILRRSRGDVRGALNDLEAIAPLPPGAGQVTVLGGRDLEYDFYELTREVLEEPRFYRSVEIRDRIDATPDDLLPWIEENLPRYAPSPNRRRDAYVVLARAEHLLARARRHRVYALWSFATELMTGGVSLSLGPDSRRGSGQVSFPQFLGEMGRTKALRSLRAGLLGKVGAHCHISRRKGAEEFLPFLEELFAFAGAKRGKDPAPERRRLSHQFGLNAEEVAFLLGTETESAAVRAVLEEETVEDAPLPPPAAQDLPRKKSRPAEPLPATAPEPRKPVQRRLAEF